MLKEYKNLISKSNSKILKLLKNNDFEKALEISESLVNFYPSYKTLELKALCLFSYGKKSLAMDSMLDLVKRFPCKSCLWNTLGLMHACMGRSEMAISCFRRAYHISPKANYISNLAIEMRKCGRLKESLDLMKNNYDKFKKDFLFLFNYGAIYYEMGEYSEAEKYYIDSIKLKNNFPPSHFNLAHCYFFSGDYSKGWEEYEWRWKQFKDYSWKKDRFPKKKLWDGGSLIGKKILIYAEQGIGDVIQFVRYVKKLDGEVILEVPLELHRLFKSLNVKLVEDGSMEKFDFHFPIASLGRMFGEISGKSYLEWNCSKWDQYSDKLKVGICWAGNPRHQNDKHRSCSVKYFNFKNVRMFSLQKDVRKRKYGEEIVDLSSGFIGEELVDLSPKLNDFGNLASAIMNMDLVVTVDTSVAHLCGALGKKCLVILPKNCDWRWGNTDSHSIWYDSLVLFRQKVLGEWESVFLEIEEFISSFQLSTNSKTH
jgi:tetratricopeptide (TPR) repeat protein